MIVEGEIMSYIGSSLNLGFFAEEGFKVLRGITAYLHNTKIAYMQKWYVANMVYRIITKFAYLKKSF